MPRPKVPSCPPVWPRVAVLALVGVAVAGCENSARFDSNPFVSNREAPRQDVSGSIASGPASGSSVVSQPLPAPSPPTTVAAGSSVSYGERGYAAYRPDTHYYSDVSGSVPARRAAPPKRIGHWTWDGGKPVTVGYGETIGTVARKTGVPASAIMETNGIRNPAAIRPGQRLVIPRYVYDSTPHAPASVPAPQRAAENVHVVEPGESLIGISRRSGVTLSALAHANNIQPYTKINIGDRLTIPSGRKLAARRAAAPKVAQPRTVATERVASVPAQNARMAKPEVRETKSISRQVEPAGAIPSFRWPVKGRIISGFGARPNGTQNDGINLAVPEGTPIKAADNGVVAYAGNELKGYGNLVLIRHSGGFVSAYANASDLLVRRGDTVKRGQVIAHAGQTGNVSSPQLHFEIRKGSIPVDPKKYLSGA
jgi:murein DD-endopeptidase MepM/ murein hydrolase activator NlpD